MPTSVEQFGPLVKWGCVRLKKYVKNFQQAKSALFGDGIVDRAPVYQIPFQLVWFVFILQSVDAFGQGGAVLLFDILEVCGVAGNPGLDPFTSKTCIGFSLLLRGHCAVMITASFLKCLLSRGQSVYPWIGLLNLNMVMVMTVYLLSFFRLHSPIWFIVGLNNQKFSADSKNMRIIVHYNI